MSFAIDSTHLAEHVLPQLQTVLDIDLRHPGQYQIYRMCAYATALHGAPTPEPFPMLASYESNTWEPDQDDDVDEVEVFHHLKQRAATSPLFEALLSLLYHQEVTRTTTLATSVAVQPRPLTASAKQRPISSFRRQSFTISMLGDSGIWGSGLLRAGASANLESYQAGRHAMPRLRFAGADSRRNAPSVFWQLHIDFVDVLSERSHPAWRPTSRRRTTLDQFQRLPSAPDVPDSKQQQHPPEAKRFKGVRYRQDRKAWSAEMRPPKHKNKVYFGESPSQTQAARMVDAAFHFYGKPHLLNFPDATPRLLSSRVIPAGLDEECKLNFVKDQAKWLALEASALPPSSTSVHPVNLVSSSGGCAADASRRFCSFSEIASFLSLHGDGDEADDGISRPQPLLLPDADAGSGGNDWMEALNGTSAGAVGAIVGASHEWQDELEWNVEFALVDAGLPASSRPSSSVRITDGWDGAEHCNTPVSANVGISSPLSGEDLEWWMNCLVRSPPAATNAVPCSPGPCQLS